MYIYINCLTSLYLAHNTTHFTWSVLRLSLVLADISQQTLTPVLLCFTMLWLYSQLGNSENKKRRQFVKVKTYFNFIIVLFSQQNFSPTKRNLISIQFKNFVLSRIF